MSQENVEVVRRAFALDAESFLSICDADIE
jgi:hypothetical protein